MANEAKKSPVEPFNSLRECLVDGNAERLDYERRLRRRSVTLSLIIQAAVLAAVLLVPLFLTSDRIALAFWAPTPVYSAGGGATHPPADPIPPRRPGGLDACHICVPPRVPTGIRIVHGNPARGNEPGPDILPGPDIPGAIQLSGGPSNPSQPPRDSVTPQVRIIRRAQLDPAMLIHRVEPAYPVVALQLHLSGHVELHAIIATDGTIQSLEAVSGNPIFFRSAKEAVRQWRYHPTILNGQAVEVETIINVDYQVR